MWFCVIPKALPSAAATFSETLVASALVCTVQLCARGEAVYWTLASPPPAWVTTREIAFWVVEELAGKVKLDPPLNSSEKFSPRTSRATTQISRKTPEMAYHSRL